MKDKNHMIILIDTEKVFDKIQYPFFYDKNSHQSGNTGSTSQCNKGHIRKTYFQHILNGQKLQHSPKIGNKTGMSTFTSLIQHCTGSPNCSNQTRRNKRHPNWKGRSKTVFICR